MARDPLKRLTTNPAIGLGVAITIGLALGSGALRDLLPFGRSAPAPAPTPPAGQPGAPQQVASHLDTLDQEI